MKIAVVGLGKLGAPLAAVLASKGNDVLGIDVVPEVVRRLEDGLAPVQEPGLQELVAANRKRLNATTELEAAAECDMTILLVPTPSDERGAFDGLLAGEIGKCHPFNLSAEQRRGATDRVGVGSSGTCRFRATTSSTGSTSGSRCR